MVLLVLGVLLWSAAHLLPCSGVSLRRAIIDRTGEGPYKGLFALTILAAIGLMVFGWRSAVPEIVYQPPGFAPWITNVAMFAALVLFLASGVPTNIKRALRHPQLTGVLTWSLAHLLSNGDSRALVLFGGLGLWSVVAMLAINRRDGAWKKPEPLPASADLKPIVAAVVVFALLFWAHPWIAGVSPLPR